MLIQRPDGPAIYTTREIALASGVQTAEIDALVSAGSIRTIEAHAGFVSEREAVRVVRALGRRNAPAAVGPGTPAARGRRFVPSLVF
jgi:hypothetical protein